MRVAEFTLRVLPTRPGGGGGVRRAAPRILSWFDCVHTHLVMLSRVTAALYGRNVKIKVRKRVKVTLGVKFSP